MADFSFTDDPRWHEKDFSTENKDSMINRAFDDQVASHKQWEGTPADKQDRMRERFKQDAYLAEMDSPANPTNIEAAANEKNIQYQGFWGIAADKFKRSFQDLGTAVAVADDLATGEFDPDYGRRTAATIARGIAAPTPAAQKELMADFNVAKKEFERAETAWGKSMAFLGGVSDIVTNPAGAVYTGLDSISSLGMSLAAGKVGAEAGAAMALVGGQLGPQAGAPEEIATVPLFAIGGGIAGMFAGSLPAEAQGKFQDLILEELETRRLAPTAENIDALVAEDAFSIPALKKARTKAVVVAAAEAITGPIIGKAAKVVSGAKTVTKKLAGKAALVVGEAASEGAGEAASQLAAEGKVDIAEVLGEIAGGAGMGPVSVAAEKSIFAGKATKAVAGVAVTEVKKAITPKSEAHEETKKINAARNEKGYRDTIEAADETTDVSGFTEPGTPGYSPVKAIDILSKRDDDESFTQAKKVVTDYQAEAIETATALAPLEEKISKGTATKTEKTEHTQGVKNFSEQQKVLTKLKAGLGKMSAVRKAKEIPVAAIDPVKSTPAAVKENIVSSFGSHGGGRDLSTAAMSTIAERSDIPSETRALASSVVSLNTSREAVSSHIQSSGKSLKGVQTDIFGGNTKDGFKGIDQVNQAVAQAMSTGDIGTAQAEVDAFSLFANRHRNKARVLGDMYELAQAGKPVPPVLQAEFEVLKKTRGSTLKSIHKGSGVLVKQVQLESKALDDAVKTAGLIIGSAKPEAAPEVKIEKPTQVTLEPKKPAKGVSEVYKTNVTSGLKGLSPEEKLSKLNTMRDGVVNEAKAKYLDKLIADTETKEETRGKKEEEKQAPSQAKEKAPAKETITEPKYGELEVQVTPPGGTIEDAVTVPYDQAMDNINKEIDLYKKIRDCIGK